jgi:hypothetical protein
MGFEPTRPLGQVLLRHRRLPFRHPGVKRISSRHAHVSTAVGHCLGVAVRTQQANIAQPIVVSPAVDMVQLERHWPSVPSAEATDFASGLLEPCLDEPPLQVRCTGVSPLDENLVEGNGWDDRRSTPRRQPWPEKCEVSRPRASTRSFSSDWIRPPGLCPSFASTWANDREFSMASAISSSEAQVVAFDRRSR